MQEINLTIQNELKKLSGELIKMLQSTTETALNALPAKDVWTAAQVSDHIRIFLLAVYAALLGPSKWGGMRPPNEKEEALRAIFLDYSQKYKAPSEALPRNGFIEKAALMNALSETSHSIEKEIIRLDLTKICTAFELPSLGLLTRLEWIYFAIFHMQRHLDQLKNILYRSENYFIQL